MLARFYAVHSAIINYDGFMRQTNIVIPVITIDGPSGSGKGTISKGLAEKLGWHFLDSGAIYRVLAYAAMQDNVSPTAIATLESIALSLKAQFIDIPGKPQQIIFRNHDIALAIRQESCGNFASKIAGISEVRSALLNYQRSFRKAPGLIADGRDMGTVIFPDATLKVFLTASAEERAKRRQLQLQASHIDVNLSSILHDLLERDARDAERKVAPLKPATDAITIDTTSLSIEEVLQQIIARIKVT